VVNVGPEGKPTEIIEAGQHAWEGYLALCRVDCDAFNEFVLRDENGGPIEQMPMHEEMQAGLDEQQYVVVMAHPESGKTQQLGVGRVLKELGTNREARLVLLNNVQDGAKKTLGSIKKYLERSAELRAVFPRLLPGNLWRDDQITVERDGFSRDPSIYCIGYHGALLGARVDGAVVDDLPDFENTRTENARRELSSWFKTTFLTRLTEHAWCAFLCNAWHEEDLSHELAEEGWLLLRYPVIGKDGTSTWPSRWPLTRIAKWRKKLGELEFARMFLCKPRDPGAETFGPEALELALRRGRGYQLLEEGLDRIVRDGIVVTGVDIGRSRRAKGGQSAVSTNLVRPNGRRQLLRLWQGRVGARELLRRIGEPGRLFPGSFTVVEDNGVQGHLVELAQELGEQFEIVGPVYPFQTGKNKHDPELGIDAMAAEFEHGHWLLPSGRGGKEKDAPTMTRALIRQLRAYVPGQHPGDALMATWMARTWGLERLARLRRGPAKRAGIRALVLG
jgi:hypothetical protein